MGINVYGLRLLRSLAGDMSAGSMDVIDVLYIRKEVLDGLEPEIQLLVLPAPLACCRERFSSCSRSRAALGVLSMKSSKSCFSHSKEGLKESMAAEERILTHVYNSCIISGGWR